MSEKNQKSKPIKKIDATPEELARVMSKQAGRQQAQEKEENQSLSLL